MTEIPSPQPKENIYAISTANVLDQATLHFALTWTAGKHVGAAREAGYHGVELWPLRPTLATQIDLDLLGSETTREGILSTHQSPRTERARDIRGLTSVAPVILLPSLDASLSHLEKLRDTLGDLPAVMYRETPQEFHTQTDITHRLIQPDPEVIEAWKVKDTQDFLAKLKEHGFTGVCLDITHLRRGHKESGETSPLADWRESIPELIRSNAVSEVHVAVGRTDPNITNLIGRDETLAELKDLLEGTTTAEATQMLHMIADTGWRGEIAVEVLPTAIKEVIGNTHHALSRQDLIGAYAKIRDSLYHIFDK